MLREYGLQRDRRSTLDACERIAVASQHMAQEYARHGFAGKVRIVHLPVTIRPAGRDQVRPDAARLLYLGRLERTKGVDQLIPAASVAARALARPQHLQISGKGTLSTQLADRAARRYPNLTVTTTGWLSREGCEEALAGADLLLLPGRWPEPFGLSGLEAAASGVPAVAFDAGGIRDWLTDGVNGRLVPTDPPDVRRFAEAIVDCLRDGPRFTRFQQQARMAAARFTMDAHLAALERMFDEIVEAARPTPNAERRVPDAERRAPST
jgi:glycosyltransferase involved in cell wall biosynthesis